MLGISTFFLIVIGTLQVFFIFPILNFFYQVGWRCKIHWLHLCTGVRPHPNKCHGYDIKQSDGEVPLMLELWGMQSTPLLPSLPGPLRPGVAALDRVISIGQTELNCVLMLNWITWNRTVLTLKLLMLNLIVWNRTDYLYKNWFSIN